MPSFKEHCQESERLFGQPYPEVHLWLDKFAGKAPYGMKQRRIRHQAAGIEEVRRLSGEGAVPVARQHIISDLKQEGWTESDPFPSDKAHNIRIGLFCLNAKIPEQGTGDVSRPLRARRLLV